MMSEPGTARPPGWALAPDVATRGSLGVTLLSVTTHASLIALAVVGTLHPREFTRSLEVVTPERVDFVLPARPAPTSVSASTPERGAPRRPRASSQPEIGPAPILEFSLAPMTVPTPDADFDRLASAYEALADSASSPFTRGVFGIVPTKGAIYSEDVVERVAAPRPGNPTPVYPPSLLRAEVEARLVAVFVIDTAGRVEERSIRFSSDDDELFERAVRDALHRSRFFPAELGRERVRQLVQQVFVFRIART